MFGFGKRKTISDEEARRIFNEEFVKTIDETPNVEMPTAGGRTSIPENNENLTYNSRVPVSAAFPFDVLKVIENLSITDRHVAYAVENIRTLGNTSHEIYFSESHSQAEIVKMKQHLENVKNGFYKHSAGIDSLVNDLFGQLAVFGCISAERVPNRNLKGIKEVVRVSPINIRFAYDKENEDYIPMQINTISASAYVQLNTATYSYISLNKYKNTEYAIPPFISALEDIFNQISALKSFNNIIKRVGMLGFLSVLHKAPMATPGESQDSYRNRLRTFLQQEVPNAERSFHSGVLVGFKDQVEVDVQAGNLNVSGAEGIVKILKSFVYSGLKQDPNMLGDNFSTTETFGKVILAKMSKQVENYQKAVAAFLTLLYSQELLLAGFKLKGLTVEFEKPSTVDKLADQDLRMKKFDNAKKEYDQGLISQSQFAQQMGYEKPFSDKPVTVVAGPSEQGNSGTNGFIKKLQSTHEFLYDVPKEYGFSFEGTTDFKDEFLNKTVGKYINGINNKYGEAINKSGNTLKKKCEDFNVTTSLTEVKEAVFSSLFVGWDKKFIDKIKPDCEENTSKIYEKYRKDKNVFKAKSFSKESFFDAPEGVFDVLDYRVIEFLGNVDNFYLGKFISDQDTIQRISLWVEKAFNEGKVPTGNNVSTERFVNEFEQTLNLERWKIRRVIETTANKARNYGNVKYMSQAKVDKYELVEIMDSRTCRHCASIDGKIFSVQASVDTIERTVNNGVENLDTTTPFLTTKNADDVKRLTGEQLQSEGYGMPPNHPHCRGRLVYYPE